MSDKKINELLMRRIHDEYCPSDVDEGITILIQARLTIVRAASKALFVIFCACTSYLFINYSTVTWWQAGMLFGVILGSFFAGRWLLREYLRLQQLLIISERASEC